MKVIWREMTLRRLVALAIVLAVQLALQPTTHATTSGVLRLDGVNDRVVVPDAPQLSPAEGITVEAWVRPHQADECHTVLSKGGGLFGFILELCGSLNFSINGIKRVGGVVPAFEWTHIAVTFDGTTIQQYANGILTLEVNQPGWLPLNDDDLAIGVHELGGSYVGYFDGDVAEVRLWSHARTEDEIRSDMVRVIESERSDLIAVWHLEGNFEEAFGRHRGVGWGGPLFTGPAAPPAPHGRFLRVHEVRPASHIPLLIPRVESPEPVLDGHCAPGEYSAGTVAAVQLPLWHDDDVAPQLALTWAFVAATEEDLFVCILGMPKTGLASQTATVDLDVDGTPDRENYYRFSAFQNGTFESFLYWQIPFPGFVPEPVAGFEAHVDTAGDFEWNAELRIPRSLLATADAGFALSVQHQDHLALRDNHGWPAGNTSSVTDVWAIAEIDDENVPRPDGRAPSVSAEHHPVRLSGEQEVEIIATADDDVDLASITIFADPDLQMVEACDFLGLNDRHGTCRFSRTYAPGRYRYWARAEDHRGRPSHSKGTQTIVVEVAGDPLVLQLSHSPREPALGQPVLLRVTATSAAGIGEIRIGTQCSFSGLNTEETCEVPFTPSPLQRYHRYWASATDSAGFTQRAVRTILFGNSGAHDYDDDGLSDAIERDLGTNPLRIDTDLDLLLDGWEVLGIHFDDGPSIDLPTMGANPRIPDVFLQYDYETGRHMTGNGLTYAKGVFQAHGVTLHITENERPPSPPDDPLETLHAAYQRDWRGDYYFAPELWWTHYYVYSGQGFGLGLGWPRAARMGATNTAHFMHEFGHTLGLHHG